MITTSTAVQANRTALKSASALACYVAARPSQPEHETLNMTQISSTSKGLVALVGCCV